MGFFPLDRELGVAEDGWSEEVGGLAVELAGMMSFREVERVLARVGHIHLSASRIWRLTQEWAGRLVDWQEQQRRIANAVPGRDQPQPGEERHSQPMGISSDGWLVNIRGEGWKEVKVGCLFRVIEQPRPDRQAGEWVESATAVDKTYVAHLGGPEEFGQHLWAEALARSIPAAYEKAFIGDGAPWIWNLCEDYFPEAEQVVDWYHALSHLHAAAGLLFGAGTEQAQRWAKSHEKLLFQGHAAAIAEILTQAAAQASTEQAKLFQAEATYFHHNQRRMRYLEFRELGWPIGSGTIEGGCKQFQARMKGSGMRWSRPGATRMLALRTVILSQSFDACWATLANSPLI